MLLSFNRYEDELLYSILARCRIRSGTISHKAFLKDAFGSDRFSACMELQPGIGRLITNLPVGSSLTSEQIIYQNTMYPLYTAFRSEEQAQAIYTEIEGDDGKNLQNSIGLMSSSIKSNAHFQYCPLCGRDDLSRNGEMYLRRMHQLPGICICIKHDVWLNQSDIPTRGANKQIFTVPTIDNCPLDYVRWVTEMDNLVQYRYIVNSIEQLMSVKYPNRSLDWFFNCYKNRLIHKGYVSSKGRVDHKSVQRDFLEFFGEQCLSMVQSFIEGENNWLRLMFQKHRKVFHPIRHLLVIQFLGLTLDQLFYADEDNARLELDNQPNALHKRKIMKKTMTIEYKEQARVERRTAWLKLRVEYPSFGINELRKLNKKVYAWLYLYDRDFLFENAPEKAGNKGGQFRVNWSERDRDTLVKVTQALEQLLNNEKRPNRISIKKIQEVIGEQCLMKKYLVKMPLTNHLIEQVVETPEQFGERRIRWAIKELEKEGEPPLWWRVIRKAGIRRSMPDNWFSEKRGQLPL